MESHLALADLAKYPFLGEAGGYVRRLGLNIEELGKEEYSSILERARQRVLEAMKTRKVSAVLDNPEVELLSFPLALAMVRATGLDHVASRYAFAEPMRVERLLQEEKPSTLAQFFRMALNVELEQVPDGQPYAFKINFAEYLTRATRLHEPEWMLINRRLENGRVFLSTANLVRLIREEIRRLIYERLKSLSLPKLPYRMEQLVQEIASISPPPRRLEDLSMVTPDKYPPCILHALDVMKKGENLPHFGRFLLTTYLLRIGKTVDDVIALFPRVPDFSERITRYQVEHIAGLRGGKVKYNVPSCKTAVAHNFCFADNVFCPTITNPVQYGSRSPALKKKAKADG